MTRNLPVAHYLCNYSVAMDVTREIMLDAPPDEVWDALTDPAELAEWFANDVELDVRPGGEGVFRWDDGSERHAVVETVEPGERVEFWWWSADEEASRVAIAIDEVAGGTRVVVTETGPAEWATAIQMRAAFPALARA
jgi:uncharacterized protein YndB with AHSA1/START domain